MEGDLFLSRNLQQAFRAALIKKDDDNKLWQPGGEDRNRHQLRSDGTVRDFVKVAAAYETVQKELLNFNGTFDIFDNQLLIQILLFHWNMGRLLFPWRLTNIGLLLHRICVGRWLFFPRQLFHLDLFLGMAQGNHHCHIALINKNTGISNIAMALT
jgi:hypothetical protein